MIAASSIQGAGSTELSRVLLADDHPAMLALTADALAGECLVVGLVADGFELLAEAERVRPDVIVLTSPCRGLTASKRRANSGARSVLPASSFSRSTKTPTTPGPHSMRAGSATLLRHALLALAVGCASIQSKENLLVAAGFNVIVPKKG